MAAVPVIGGKTSRSRCSHGGEVVNGRRTMTMSLRLRVLLALILAVLTSSAVGAGLAGWLARQALREELDAAMAGGRQAVLRAYEDLPRSDHAPRGLSQVAATLDGNPPLRAFL